MHRFLIWTSIPNHYQFSFFHALTTKGVDLRVCYYSRVPESRRDLGWDAHERLPTGHSYVPQTLPAALETVPDWKQRIHIVPGYRYPFLRRLARLLCSSGVQWAHWSEPSHSGLRWWLSYPVKRWYGHMVNRYALGAFGIGIHALADIHRWGVSPEKTAVLPYAAPAGDTSAAPDRLCHSFKGGRRAFLFLGALCRRKAIDVALRAFHSLGGEASGWVMLLVGNDKSRGSYCRLAELLGLQDRVLFRNAVDHTAIPSVLTCAEVLLLPSRFDGWGVVLNEAASLGLALIASDRVGAAYHLVEPGETGFRVRAGSVASLAAAMRSYVHAPDLARLHGTNAQHKFADYTPGRNAEKFLATIRSWQAMKGV